MNWSELQSIWRKHKPARPAGIEPGRLGETLEHERRRLARRLFARDCVEASAGLLVVAFFSQFLWIQGIAYWPVAIAILIVLAVTGFFVRERIRVHRSRVGPAAPLLMKLEAEIAELEHQRRLLLAAGWWYVAPLMTSVLIVLGTIVGNNLSRLHAVRAQVFLGGYLVFCGILAWGVTMTNRRTARTKIEPQLIEIQKLRDEISSSHLP